ncbi:MAG: PP2C family protein-serine/threonine phosphatase [Acidobacteriota bacterium]
MDTQAPVIDTYVRDQLLVRRQRLDAASRRSADPWVATLMAEVDTALADFERGEFGRCTVCHEPVEADRLLRNPLVQRCLDHLTADEQQSLLQDLALARDVQQSLLPAHDVVIEGWQVHYQYVAARRVGGDYCDLIRLPGRSETLLLLGDVVGKGVAASIMMGTLHAIVRSFASLQLSPSALLTHANRLFCESTPGAAYATLVCLVVAPDGGIELFNAGHPRPFLRSRGGAHPIALESPPGLPLGMFCDATYRGTARQLEPGEALVLFTDGITEARGASDDEYGSDRLAAALAAAPDHADPRALVAHMLEDVKRFAPEGVYERDDATLLVACRR